MKPKDLQKYADDPMWHGDEESSAEYLLPIAQHPLLAGIWTWRNWKALARRHIVDVNRAAHTLTENRDPALLFEAHGFWCDRSPESHLSCFHHAIDLLVPDGTHLRAAHDGTIVACEERFDEWGMETDKNGNYIHALHLNYVAIQVNGVEFVEYGHIAKGSLSALGLHIGSRVCAGQPIGIVGKNGVTDRDHLHFSVFRADFNPDNPFGIKSLAPRFRR